MALFVDIEKKLGNFMLKVKLETGDDPLALLGASGCGKSMTLKCIAGIETPDRGRIVLNDRILFDSGKKINVPAGERRAGYLFQHGALFPNMNVLKNIKCGVRQKCSEAEKDRIAREMLGRLKLGGFEEMMPSMLSQGQQQRVALARILVNEPEILMLDEPFSALDSHLRFELEAVLRETIKTLAKPAILVSHNRDEAFRICERLAIMNNGTIDVCGGRKEVFANPLTKNAAVMTGCKNIAGARILEDGTAQIPEWGIELNVMPRSGDNTGEMPVFDDIEYIGVRMHDIHPGPGENELLLEIKEVVENPFSYTVMLSAGEQFKPVGMELEKNKWEEICTGELKGSVIGNRIRVNITSGAILMLTDKHTGSAV